MTNADVAAYIGRWEPSTVSPQGAAFARDVITRTGPAGRERAKSLLWAAGKLADWAAGLGLEAVPEVLPRPSTAERFTRCAPGLSGVARRTPRTNLRFIGRRVVPQLYPADLPLPRERSKAPYTAAEIGGYLALADARPTRERRMRATGLVCLGAGAGLIRSDLRDVRGTDVACRSGGVVVAVRGARPRTVPALARCRAGRSGIPGRRARESPVQGEEQAAVPERGEQDARETPRLRRPGRTPSSRPGGSSGSSASTLGHEPPCQSHPRPGDSRFKEHEKHSIYASPEVRTGRESAMFP
jgi:hypothetical protein